jgi:hypothetical protein
VLTTITSAAPQDTIKNQAADVDAGAEAIPALLLGRVHAPLHTCAHEAEASCDADMDCGEQVVRWTWLV